MSIYRGALLSLLITGVFVLAGCALFQRGEPMRVMLAGVDPLPSEGLELRMLVKLRLQNPNGVPLEFDGVFVEMNVQGKRFASGVSDASGNVPRYGETIISVPMSISAFDMARQAIGIMNSNGRGKLAYELSGKLSGPAFSSVRFTSDGELALPANLGR